jgi:phage terminase Nu1 subunit (DNA packaging protein)
MPYKFPDELQREIDAFAEDDAGQVDQEVAITRWLIKRAVEGGRDVLANSLLVTLAKLSATQIHNEIRCGKLIERAALIHIAQQMADAVARRLDGLPNREALTDDLAADFGRIIRQERRLLTHDPQVSGDNDGSRD